MPGARDPDRPSGISPRRNLRSMLVFSVVRLVSRRCHNISIIAATYRFLCVGFRHVNNVATCIFTLNEAESLQGGAAPLWPRKYSVYASRLLFACIRRRIREHRSASRARLDTGGWLALARPGLSPGKKRQASLDALTFRGSFPPGILLKALNYLASIRKVWGSS